MLLLGLNWAARPSFLSSPLHRSGLLRRPGKPLLRRLRGSAGLRTKRCSGGTARDTTAWFRTACSAPVRARNRPAATPSLRVGTTATPPRCRGLCRRWTCLLTTHTHRNEEQTPFESLRGLLGFAGSRPAVSCSTAVSSRLRAALLRDPRNPAGGPTQGIVVQQRHGGAAG